MSNERQPSPALYTQVEVTADSVTTTKSAESNVVDDTSLILRKVVSVLERQNELLEELVAQTNAAQRQRAAELGQWKQANPQLARHCRMAAETLSKVQTAYLENLTSEVIENSDALTDGEFMLTEFVDRFGPRLAHLNGVLQVLSQLSGNP